VKKGALVSEHYTTVNVLRTITDVLGLEHLGLYDATQAPMTAVFDPSQASWTYTASASSLLKTTLLPLPATLTYAAAAQPTHGAQYWARNTRRFDFTSEDKVDAAAYNRVLWQGLMGDRPYPTERSGLDLSKQRAAVIKEVSLRQ